MQQTEMQKGIPTMRNSKLSRSACAYVLLVSISCVFSSDASVAAEIGGREIARSIVDASLRAFIERGLCTDAKDCRAKELVFFDADRQDAAYVLLYGVNDMNAIAQIVSFCLQKYEDSNRKITIVLSVRKMSHREYGVWRRKFEEPLIKIQLKRA